jgi:hypothetical protein
MDAKQQAVDTGELTKRSWHFIIEQALEPGHGRGESTPFQSGRALGNACLSPTVCNDLRVMTITQSLPAPA